MSLADATWPVQLEPETSEPDAGLLIQNAT